MTSLVQGKLRRVWVLVWVCGCLCHVGVWVFMPDVPRALGWKEGATISFSIREANLGHSNWNYNVYSDSDTFLKKSQDFDASCRYGGGGCGGSCSSGKSEAKRS